MKPGSLALQARRIPAGEVKSTLTKSR